MSPIAIILLLVCLLVLAPDIFAHSNAGAFSAHDESAPPDDEADHHDEPAASERRYPATVIVDPRHVVDLVIKVNARIVNPRNLYVGRPVEKGEVLAELESAELETVQKTYLAVLKNVDAVNNFSVTSPQKLVEGRMNLEWRGMAPGDIEQIEIERAPLKYVPIRAPASGYLYSLNIYNNQILNAGVQTGLFTAIGTSIASIADPTAMTIEASIPATEAARLTRGQAATIFFPSQETGWTRVPGQIELVSPLVDPANQRQLVRLRLTGGGRSARGRVVNGMKTFVSLEAPDHAH